MPPNAPRPTEKKPRQPRPAAWSQGGLDGLCCLYATVNALQHLRGKPLKEEAAVALFRHLATGLADKFPALLWEGSSMRDVRLVLDRADQWARRHYGFGVARSEPLLRKAPSTDTLYWRRLEQLLAPSGRALIVGLKEPWEHWSVVTHVTPRTLRFLDSLTIKIARRADVSLRRGSTYRFDPHQVFLLERVTL